MDGPCLWFPEKLLADFDVDLQTFYHAVITKELDLSRTANAAAVRQALREVAKAYSKGTVDAGSSVTRFDSPERRCAYVVKHCSCFSSAVGRHFLQLLRANPLVLNEAIFRRRINLCCLGGGPATDAIAVATVVNAVSNAVLVRSRQKLLLEVWVVDISEEWRTTVFSVFRTLTENSDFCDAEKMDVDFRFLSADLTDPWKQQLKQILYEADIVTIVYFVSAVNGSPVRDKCICMLQNIMDSLKPGALLFFLDSAKQLHCDAILAAAGSFKNLKQIYGPFVQVFHTLSIRSIKKFIELYFSQFRAILCLTNCFITSCGWTKENAEVHSPGVRVWKKGRSWEKKVSRNTKRQVKFRERVEKLLLSELDMDFATDDLDDPGSSSEPDCQIEEMYYASKSKRKRIYTWME